MKTKSIMVLAILASLAITAMAGPKLALSWKNPKYNGAKFKHILVLAMNGKSVNRLEFEDQLVASISRPGSKVTASYEFIARPDSTPIDTSDLRAVIREHNFDAIVVARLTKKDEKNYYVPGQVWSPYPYYGTFYGYYSAVYPAVYTPGYMATEKTAEVEVNFYSTTGADGELVWTGTTNTFDASSVKKVIKGLVKVVTKDLEKEDIIAKEAK